VRSRCQTHELPRWSDDELTAYASEHGIAPQYVAAAAGSMSRLRSLAAVDAVAHRDPITRRLLLAKTLDRTALLEALAHERPSSLGEQLELVQRGARPEWVVAAWGRRS
jgi:hypothetical protein